MKKTITMLMASIMLVSITACTSDAPKENKKDKDKIAAVEKDKKQEQKKEKEDKKEDTSITSKEDKKTENSSTPTPPNDGGNTTPQQPTTPPANNNNQKPVTPPIQPPIEEKPVTPPVCTPEYPVLGNSGKVFATEEEAWNWAESVWWDENSPWSNYCRFFTTNYHDTCGQEYWIVEFVNDCIQ